jgi:hypothetical protein
MHEPRRSERRIEASLRSAPLRSAQKKLALSSLAPLNLQSLRIAPVKSASQRFAAAHVRAAEVLEREHRARPAGLGRPQAIVLGADGVDLRLVEADLYECTGVREAHPTRFTQALVNHVRAP